MDLKGKVILSLPIVTGEGKNGQWRKQEFLIETGDQYPKKVMFSLMGAKIDQNQVKEGQEVVVSFDAESREYNGKYYTNLNAWKVTPAGSAPVTSTNSDNFQPSNTTQSSNSEAPTSMSYSNDESTSDDLPF
ncbi:MAG: DUF3127 domain-containing protein [Bacteroidia bacterium]|nr:DUF3127 domain-containing protein [Bacteroidia bacterium]